MDACIQYNGTVCDCLSISLDDSANAVGALMVKSHDLVTVQ